MTIDESQETLGIALPLASNPAANYTNCVRAGNFLFASRRDPGPKEGVAPKGKLGREYTTQDGYDFARSTALDTLAAVKLELGSLDRVRRVVKLQDFLNAAEVFGDRGVHTRSVLGASSLRAGLPIVIEAVFEIE